MNRGEALTHIREARKPFDFLIIGGGASGLGVALDAASRGYRTVVVEQSDFASGTSSRSTKLVHGGVRYLQQGDVRLVREALHERGLLLENASHLVHPLGFIIPLYRWWEAPYYGVGLSIYDRLAGRLGIHPSRVLSRSETLERVPNLLADNLKQGVAYFDGQFDDARLAITLARTIFDCGGIAVNYVRLRRFIGSGRLLGGAVVEDVETGEEFEIAARVLVNAAGAHSDRIRQIEDPATPSVIAQSQGSHIVLPRSFLPGRDAVLVPRTSDGRVLFAIPWHDHVLVGTTDIEVQDAELDPKPMDEEVDFLLTTVSSYLKIPPRHSDILSAFSGIRPLVRMPGGARTSRLSRDHSILISDGGLISILGGKWTTFRRMGQDVVDQAEALHGMKPRACVTEALPLHGAGVAQSTAFAFPGYGTDSLHLEALGAADPELLKPLDRELPTTRAEVVWAARFEMARSVEDVLARRTRMLFLNAEAAENAAPETAQILASELGRPPSWVTDQIHAFRASALRYRPGRGG